MPLALRVKEIPKNGIIVLGIVVVPLLLLSQYLFPVDDDYCFFVDIKNYETSWDYLVFWYQNWAGRWLATLLRYFYYSEGLLETPLWLGPTLLFCAVGGALFISNAIYGVKAFSSGAGVFTAVIFILLMSQPRYQIFWAPAGFDYTVGYLILGCFLVCCRNAVIAKNRQQGYIFIAGAYLFGILASGFSELQALIPPAIAFGVFLLVQNNRFRWAGLTISCSIAASVNLFSPGAAARKLEIGFTGGIGDIFRDVALYGTRFLIVAYLPLLLITFLPQVRVGVIELGEWANKTLTGRGCWLIAISVISFPLFCFGLISWAQGAVATGRTTNLSLLLCIATWPIIFFKVQEVFKIKIPLKSPMCNSLGILGIVFLLAVNLPYYAQDLMLGGARSALENFHQNESSIKDSGRGQTIVWVPLVRSPKSIPTSLVSENKNYWVNKCIAKAYSVKSVHLYNKSRS